MSKRYGGVSIALGFAFLLGGALDARGHFAIWAASSILLGLFFILFGASFSVADKRKKTARRVSFGFLGVGLLLLGIALAPFLS